MAEEGVSMREILFRAKRLDTGEWVEGFYLNNPEWDRKLYGVAHWIVSCKNGIRYEVDPATVGQFTGLVDKNGRRIFEGDVVCDRFGRGPAVVEFCVDDVASCGCCYPSFAGSGFKAYECNLTESEVIGNIRDNPELLEGGQA